MQASKDKSLLASLGMVALRAFARAVCVILIRLYIVSRSGYTISYNVIFQAFF